MNRRSLFRRTVLCGVVLLAATATSSSIVVVLGATALAIEPAGPRDRAAPSLPGVGGRPLRVTILGTSLSSTARYHWPDEVGVRLSSRIAHAVEVHRVAQPGATSTWGVEQIGRVLATNPDIVLVEFAVNDADVRHHLTVRASVARHERILAGLQSGRHKTAVVLLTMNPASGPRAWVRPFLSRYYAEYVGLAQRYNTGLVDLYARWTSLPADERDLADGLHPSDAAATHVIVGPVVDALARVTGP